MLKNNFYQKDVVSVDDFSRDDLTLLFERTKEMKELVEERGGDERLKRKIVAALFFEPSTRTFSSFIAAAQRLGAGIIPLNGMQNTSVAKGESFEHTVQVFSRYADCLVIRHPEAGMPAIGAEYADIPVINAGDGIGEHPTQAFFDTFTILEHFETLNNLKITLIGDLKYGRTVHSLSKTLVKYGSKIKFNFVAPSQLMMPDDVKEKVASSGSIIHETENLEEVLTESDVLYVTRVQKERFNDLDEYERLKRYYIVDKKAVKAASKNMLIMHPLPIAAGELATELDDDSRSVYLNKQLTNGLCLRMALLDLVLKHNE